MPNKDRAEEKPPMSMYLDPASTESPSLGWKANAPRSSSLASQPSWKASSASYGL